jgi:hypothetical protein
VPLVYICLSPKTHEKRLDVKSSDLKNKALNSENGEYIFGLEDTGSHACYMIYGLLKSKEKGRLIKPGKGHEEIILALEGDLEVTGYYSGTLKEGSAMHIEGDHECFLENQAEHHAVYIIAGGHSDGGHD